MISYAHRRNVSLCADLRQIEFYIVGDREGELRIEKTADQP
jgi:hypothetical protein